MNRATKRADSAIRLVDELLSGGKLQRSKRLMLLRLRRELQQLRQDCDVGKGDLVTASFRWVILLTKLYEFLDRNIT